MTNNMITAKIVAHSISPDNIEIVTFEVEQPKFINAEVNTHRVFSRNGSSSRAIKASTLIKQVDSNPYYPTDVRLNEKGMQGFQQAPKDIITEFHSDLDAIREFICVKAVNWADPEGLNIHKQHISRYLEPFLMQKFLITTTEMLNWDNLRFNEQAQPEIYYLAKAMREAYFASTPKELKYGEWHLPFIDYEDSSELVDSFIPTVPQQAFVSSGMSAAISYRNMPEYEASLSISNKLLSDAHLSPFEHQATPLDPELVLNNSEDSPFNDSHISVRLDGSLWGGNLRGWGQLRGIIEGRDLNAGQ